MLSTFPQFSSSFWLLLGNEHIVTTSRYSLGIPYASEEKAELKLFFTINPGSADIKLDTAFDLSILDNQM